MFLSAHYAGEDLCPKFEQGEPWKKVFGPVFIYLNSVMDENDPLTLWDDAKNQVVKCFVERKKLLIASACAVFMYRSKRKTTEY